MAGNYTSSENTSTNVSSSQPVQTPQSAFSLKVGEAALSVGQYVLNWALTQYANTSAITDQMVNNYLVASEYGMQMAKTQIDQYMNTYVPEMNQLASEAATYSSPSRVSYNMGAAGAQASYAGAAANQNTLQSLRSYGVDPSSGMYGDILAAQNTATGASVAGAENQSQVNTEAEGRNLLQSSITAGEQLPGDIVNSLNSAYQGVTGAENSVLSNANTGATMLNTAAPFFNAAANTKLPQNATQGGGSSGGQSQGSPQQPTPSQPQQQAYGNIGKQSPSAGPPGVAGGAPGGPVDGGIPGGSPSGDSGDSFDDASAGLGTIDPSASNYEDPGLGGGSATNLGSDPINQQFTNYNGDTTNPFTDSYGSSFNDNSFTNGDFSVNALGGMGGDAIEGGSTFSTPDSPAGGFGSSGSSSGEDGSGDTSDDTSFDTGATPLQTYNGAGSGSGGSYGGGGYYAKGGRVRHNFRPPQRGVLPTGNAPVDNATTGGGVPMGASPSAGRNTDDVPARLNAGEFVIPKDAVAWKGQEFFHKLIQGARKARVTHIQGSGAQGHMKPPLHGAPQFVSHGGVGGR